MKDIQYYENGVKTQVSCYINDTDFTQPYFVGVVNINLSQIVNEKRDKRGKVPSQHLEIELDRCDYGDTSVKVVLSAKKNLRISKHEKIQEIQTSAQKKPETKDGTFMMISNEEIDNFEEKYLSDEDEDEFFRGYSHAKEFSHIRDTVQSDPKTQEMRNKIILEDFSPGIERPGAELRRGMSRQEDTRVTGMMTPFKGDQDTVHITQTREISRGRQLGSGTKFDLENIKTLDLDAVDDFPNNNPDQTNDRDSTIKKLLDEYEQGISKLNSKAVKSSREALKENSGIQSDKKRINDVYKRCKRELERTKSDYEELQHKYDKLIYDFKQTGTNITPEIKKRDAEITDLKSQNKSLKEEINSLLNYKSKYEALRNENLQLLENEENMEAQIQKLQMEMTKQEPSRATIEFNPYAEENEEPQDQLQIYAEKIRSLEAKLEEKEKDLRHERLDADLKFKEEIKIIEEGFNK